jgi:hypothetical protein
MLIKGIYVDAISDEHHSNVSAFLAVMAEMSH